MKHITLNNALVVVFTALMAMAIFKTISVHADAKIERGDLKTAVESAQVEQSSAVMALQLELKRMTQIESNQTEGN